MKHLYLAIENVGLNDTQRDTFIDALKQLGPHWRSREINTFTPIVWVYNEETDEWEKTGGAPITIIQKYHHNLPSIMNHWRVRLDKQAAIFEALFKEENLTIDAFKQRLANIFDVDPSTIGDSTQQTQYGPVVTFSRGGDRLRFLLFGGVNATWMESGDEVRSYLAANIGDWEEEVI